MIIKYMADILFSGGRSSLELTRMRDGRSVRGIVPQCKIRLLVNDMADDPSCLVRTWSMKESDFALATRFWPILALLVMLFVSAASASPIILFEDVPPAPPDYAALFAPENQAYYIVDGFIACGPFSYSVYDDYTMKERQIIYQQAQKYLLYSDPETLLYLYQYVVEPYPFPYAEFPLYTPPMIPVPAALPLLILGLVCLSLSSVWIKRGIK